MRRLAVWLGLAAPEPATVWLPCPDNNPACLPDGTRLYVSAYGTRVDNGPGQPIADLPECEWLYRPEGGQ